MSMQQVSLLAVWTFLVPALPAQNEPSPSISHSSWTTADGLPQNSVSGISQDSAGYLWVATFGGLARFDGRHFEVLDLVSRPDLPANRFSRVHISRNGTAWVWAQEVGLFSYRDDHFTHFETPGFLRRLAEDSRGQLWGTFQKGLGRIDEQGVELVEEGGFQSILAAEDGSLWVSAAEGLLFHFENGSETVLGQEAGLPSLALLTLLEDEDGILWGGNHGGVWRSTDSTRTEFEQVDGAPDLVQVMARDERGALWFGCRDHLSRWDPGADSPTVVAEGNVNCFFEDARGNLWAGSLGNGLHCLRYAPLHDAAATLGLPLEDTWSVTGDASGTVLVVFDRNLVEIRNGEEVKQRTFRENVTTVLVDRDGDRWLGRFTGVSRIREGIESNGRRAANYSYLRPGDYEIQVRARNGCGPWSPVVKERFEVEARFHETAVFLVGILLLVGVGVFALAERRVKRAHTRTAEQVRLVEQREQAELSLSRSQGALRRLSRELLSNQESERRRISRELHDDVTQRLAALAIQTELLENHLDTTSSRTRDQLHEVVQKTQQLAGDVQLLSRRLHPIGLRTLGLSEAVRQECEAFTRRTEVPVELDEAVASDEVAEDVAVGAFRILQESLHNIEKRARTGAVRISVSMETDELVLSITDSGRGFDPENDSDVGLGLITMQERAASIGGELSILSKPGKGTTVRLRAPGRSKRA